MSKYFEAGHSTTVNDATSDKYHEKKIMTFLIKISSVFTCLNLACYALAKS